LGNSKITSNLATTDPVFTVHQQPKGYHPFIHPKRAILKDVLDFHGELPLAVATEPEATC
jgi:hypothetical protein